MPISGTVNGSVTNKSSVFSFYFTWCASQSVTGNYSDVTVETYWKTTNTAYEFDTVGDRSASITINGTTTSISKRFNLNPWSENPYMIQTATTRVYHHDDGTKSITISARANGHAASYGTSSSESSSGDCTASATVTLSTIARASVPTLSASPAKMGNTITITTNRKSSSFTHTLKYTFGGTTETIATGVGDSHPWTVPDLAEKCNNATSGKATISCLTYSGSTLVGTKTVDVTLNVPSATTPSISTVTIGKDNPVTTTAGSTNFKHLLTYSFNGKTGKVNNDKVASGIVWWTPYDLAGAIPSKTEGTGTLTCETYNGTAKVGTTSIPFTAVVPDNSTTKPKITAMALSPSGNLPSTFDGLYIQRKTKVVADFTASSSYSSVASHKMVVDNKSYNGDPATSEFLSKVGNITVNGYVTDARGFVSEPSDTTKKTINVIPYESPDVVRHSSENNIICERCTSDGTFSDSGQYLRIKARRSYSKVMSGGTQKNFCLLQYRYKTSNAGSYSNNVTLLATNATSDEVDVILDGIVESQTTSYTVQLIVTDTIGETVRYTFDIPTAGTDFHLRERGNGGAFGKYSEKDGVLECAWDGEFQKDLSVAGDLFAGHIARIGLYDYKDFDELVYKTGYYTSTSAPSASSCSNYPVDKTGVLEVISAMVQNSTTLNWWGFAYQRYRTHDGEEYTRSYYVGDGWSDWVIQDKIVSQGFSSPWYYKRYASGDAECYCSRTVDVNVNIAWGSALHYGTVSTINYPFTFKEPPVCNVDIEYGSTNSSLFIASCGYGTATYARPVMLVRTTAGTVNCKLLYQVKGRWK